VVRKRLGGMRLLLLFGQGEIEVKLPGPAFCYDVRRHQPLGFTDSPALEAELGPAIVALAPYEVGELQLDAASTGRLGRAVACETAVKVDGVPEGMHVLRLEVARPDGTPHPAYAANVPAAGGRAGHHFTPAWNDPTGTWQVRATDVMSGRNAEAVIAIEP
jgi:hypothetical protein